MLVHCLNPGWGSEGEREGRNREKAACWAASGSSGLPSSLTLFELWLPYLCDTHFPAESGEFHEVSG